MLESELKNESERIRTIIKAREIHLAGGKSFAVFRVDSRHHLISLASMIDPSPDWIVGVAGLELCLDNCTWIEHKKLNLYPWDAGTDSGPTYLSPDQPTNPQDIIRRIKTNIPNDSRSPFFDNSDVEMKPMAKLYINRQRLYEKVCDQNQSATNKACATTTWSVWSECNVKCGPGKRHRQRNFANPALAAKVACKNKLSQKENCQGEQLVCFDAPQDLESQHSTTSKECQLTDWSAWSSCSEPCGWGVRTRYRKYVNRKAIKKCQKQVAFPPELEENSECHVRFCTVNDTVKVPPNRNCKFSNWSYWSACNTTCGIGKQIRIRHRIIPPNISEALHRKLVNEKDCDKIKLTEEVMCGVDLPPCTDPNSPKAPDFCFLEPKIGNCRAHTNRWFYDSHRKDCVLLYYSGCGGNENNFKTKEACLATCHLIAAKVKKPRTYQ